ncbi:protealysin inhibitor emfourin [Streptomyces sp. NPDC005408]|uniref:protealysin inhibitor emfourin n=1 Tax=Streptomyces sp. NPDC005408 TaxID=3155341 RepID=UPI0033B29F5B
MRRLRRGGFGAAGVLLAVLLAAGCTSSGSGDGDGGSSPPGTGRGGSSPPGTGPGSASASSAPTATPTTPAAARPLVAVTVTGGIAGVHNELLVRDDGTYTTSTKTGPGGSGRMTPAELTALRRALEKADFARLPREATGSPVADGFSYRITYAGHTVTTDETTRLPALRDVFAALPEE